MLGALLTLTLLSFVLISLHVYTQLGETRRIGRTLVNAERQLDVVLQAQIDQETGLRGFVATGERFFLEPYSETSRRFDGQFRALSELTRQLGSSDVDATVADVRSLHRRWLQDVARPLLAEPRRTDAAQRLKLGKRLMDQVRADAGRINDLLQERLAVVQSDVQRSIDTTLASAVALIVVCGALGLVFVFTRVRLEERIARGRALVEGLQRTYLSGINAFEGARVGAAYSSATRHAGVGGDLFDVLRLDRGRALVTLADISGKGIDAAVNTALVKYSIRTLSFEGENPGKILGRFNEIFLTTIDDPSLFVAVFVGIIDTRAMQISYGSAGIAGAYLRRRGAVAQLEVTGPVVGLERSMTFATRTIALAADDLLVLATDGLSEARDRRREILGSEGAMELVRDAPSDPQRCADSLADAVRARTSRQLRDDLAVLAIAIDGRAA